MPTIATARGEVLKLLGSEDDLTASPELVALVDAWLGRTQQMLAKRWKYLNPRRVVARPLVAGCRWYSAPCQAYEIRALSLRRAGCADAPIAFGGTAVADDNGDPLNGWSPVPAFCDWRATLGITAVTPGLPGSGLSGVVSAAVEAPTGSDYGRQAVVTAITSGGAITGYTVEDAGADYVQAPLMSLPGGATATAVIGEVLGLRLSSTPNLNDGTLVIDYQLEVSAMVTESTVLVMPIDPVVIVTAATVAKLTKNVLVATVEEMARETLKQFDRQAPARGSVSLGQRR